jgi:A/G-specific adenine glycosylase
LTEAQLISAREHTIDATIFRKRLIDWGRNNFRAFSWRFTDDPYRVLIAEVMLHRTQAIQVVPVYERFIEKYPDETSLSHASREELIIALSSLGLRWRAELVHEMAVMLQERFGGRVPHEKSELLSLPGVSDYIAGAVRCFALNLPEPIVDTNTVRVVGRLFGLEIKDSSRRNRLFKELISALVDPDEPRLYNFALLDLAALVCTKSKPPRCLECPVQQHCSYGLDPSTKKSSTSSHLP